MEMVNSIAGNGIKDIAVNLCDAAGKKVMPQAICDIAKKRTIKSMLASAVPVPGGDVVANVYNMTQMYKEINDSLGIKTSEHMIATVMSATAANLGTEFIAKQAAKYVAGNLLKTVPGVGTAAGTVLEAGASAALTYTAACIYMNAITRICKETGKTPDALSGDEIKDAVKNYSSDNEKETAALVEKGTETFSQMSKMFISSVKRKVFSAAKKGGYKSSAEANESVQPKTEVVQPKTEVAEKKKSMARCLFNAMNVRR